MTARTPRSGGASPGWALRASRFLHRSPWFDVRQDSIELPDGTSRAYTFVEHPGSVFVVPVLDDGRVVLIRSFRYTLDDWCWEVPAGGLGDKPGKTELEVARDELAEEAGASCKRLVKIGRFALANGFARHHATFFIAEGITLDRTLCPDEFEVIDRVGEFTFDEIFTMMARGELTDGDSAFALLLAARYLSAPIRSTRVRAPEGRRS